MPGVKLDLVDFRDGWAAIAAEKRAREKAEAKAKAKAQSQS
jgi:hypothetical protein